MSDVIFILDSSNEFSYCLKLLLFYTKCINEYQKVASESKITLKMQSKCCKENQNLFALLTENNDNLNKS